MTSMNIKFLLLSMLLMYLIWSCSQGLQSDKMYTLSEIKHHARNGQLVQSQGILTERTGKKDFMVTAGNASIKINLSAYKKESNILKENSKIVFTGVYRNSLFAQPEIEVKYMQKLEDFR